MVASSGEEAARCGRETQDHPIELKHRVAEFTDFLKCGNGQNRKEKQLGGSEDINTTL